MKYSIWTNDTVDNGVETSGSLVFETDSKKKFWGYIERNDISPKHHHLEIERIVDGLPDVETITIWHDLGGLNFGGL